MEDTIRSEILVRFAGLAQQVGLDPITALLLLIGVAPGWNVAKAGWRSACLAYRGAKAVWGWATKASERSELCETVLRMLASGDMKLEPCGFLGNSRLRVSFKEDEPSKHLSWIRTPAFPSNGTINWDKGRNLLPLLDSRERKVVEAFAYKIGMALQEYQAHLKRQEIIDALTEVSNEGAAARQSCS